MSLHYQRMMPVKGVESSYTVSSYIAYRIVSREGVLFIEPKDKNLISPTNAEMDMLNYLGEYGWEMVSLIPATSEYYTIFYLKREIENNSVFSLDQDKWLTMDATDYSKRKSTLFPK